jgi:hypothetical protein
VVSAVLKKKSYHYTALTTIPDLPVSFFFFFCLQASPNCGGQMTKVDMANYIRPRFLGVLGYFDQRLKNEAVSIDSKTTILASLCDVIKFMGAEHVSSVKHKILSTLNTGLGVSSSLLCTNW